MRSHLGAKPCPRRAVGLHRARFAFPASDLCRHLRASSSANRMRRILIHFDTDPVPSVFDRVVAIDAGVDELFSYGGITRGKRRVARARGDLYARSGRFEAHGDLYRRQPRRGGAAALREGARHLFRPDARLGDDGFQRLEHDGGGGRAGRQKARRFEGPQGTRAGRHRAGRPPRRPAPGPRGGPRPRRLAVAWSGPMSTAAAIRARPSREPTCRASRPAVRRTSSRPAVVSRS